MTALNHRYDFVYFFDVSNGNPNGDPDAGNLPRLDPETNRGLVTDVCLKRKIRNYVEMLHADAPGNRIYVQDGAILNERHREAYKAIRKDEKSDKDAKLSPKGDEEAKAITRWMCANFFDVRAFGAVMSTGINAGQVRGPLQFSFARSAEPIAPLEITITRMAATTEKERDKNKPDGEDDRRDNRTMGRKYVVPYGLYRVHGYVNAKLAERTGFSAQDMDLVWAALRDMFDHDRSASRGEMSARRLIVFQHESALGNAQAHRLFERVSVNRRRGDESLPVGHSRTHNWPPARAFSDYEILLNDQDLPQGVSIVEPF